MFILFELREKVYQYKILFVAKYLVVLDFWILTQFIYCKVLQEINCILNRWQVIFEIAYWSYAIDAVLFQYKNTFQYKNMFQYKNTNRKNFPNTVDCLESTKMVPNGQWQWHGLTSYANDNKMFA
jgi:hypothetical protein